MRDRTAVCLGALAGAVTGGLAGWLYLTDEGRRVRERLEPQIHTLAVQAIALTEAARRARAAARDGMSAGREVASRPTQR